MSGPSVTTVATIGGTIVGNLLVDAAGDIFGAAEAVPTIGDEVFEVAAGTDKTTTLGVLNYQTTGGDFTGGLVEDALGNLCGTTIYGGTSQNGTVYEIDAATHTLSALASPEAGSPEGPPVVDSAGNLFFAVGGSEIDEVVAGSGAITKVVSIDARGALAIDGAGDIFGASGSGSMGYGSVFEIAAGSHDLTTLVNFDGTNGEEATGAVVFDAAGNAYGSASNLFEISAGTQVENVLAPFSAGSHEQQNQIAADANGDLFGTTTAPGSPVYELVAGSHTTTTLFANAEGVAGLTADAQGDLFGADGGTIEEFVPCYCPGTRILTDLGEIAVERLAIGDCVVTPSGALETIRWIGRRSYAGRFIASNILMLPVCIKADALADGQPHTDLWVSPGHGLFVDGQLVPAWRLVNGVSIVQAKAVEEVTYIHLELDSHCILLANGAGAESFLDDGCRRLFHNAESDRPIPSGTIVPLAPRLEDGLALQFVQTRLARRAGAPAVAEPAGLLRGFVDDAMPHRVRGWAQDVDNPEEPVALEVLVGGEAVMCVLANGYRADLRLAALGSGCHAFDAAIPAGLEGSATVRRIVDGSMLVHLGNQDCDPGLRVAS